MKTLEELQVYFEQEMKPELDEFEKERVKAKRFSLYAIIIGVVLTLILFVVFYSLRSSEMMYLVALIPLVVGNIVRSVKKSSFSGKAKEITVKKIMEFCGLSYHPTEGSITGADYDASDFSGTRVDRYSAEDNIEGMIDKTSFKLCELHTEYEYIDPDDNTTKTKTLFKGMFIMADFHKNFNGRTMLRNEVAEKFLGERLGKFFNSMGKISNPGKLVKLEDVTFEKEFAVYSTDEIEARYILSPSMMERMVNLKKMNEGKPVEISFKDNILYIAMTTDRNLFELSLKEPINDFKVTKRIYEELMFSIGFIEELNLNTRIWDRQ